MQTVESHRQFINRPNNETPMLLRYRQVRGGSLLLEYPPIPTRGPGAATRKVDGVLLPDVAELETSRGRSRVFDWELATARERLALDELVAGSKTEILQAKNSRLGPYLIGQTLFSRDLMRSSVGVAIAGPASRELLPRPTRSRSSRTDVPEAVVRREASSRVHPRPFKGTWSRRVGRRCRREPS
jgi:hypothetical protein